MASTYSNLKIQLMATGENSGTWGNVTNVNLGTALEQAITGSVDVTVSSDTTLSLTDTNAAQDARALRLNIGGSGGFNLTVPSIQKLYLVNNGTLGAVVVKNASGATVTVPTAKTMWVYSTGSGVVDAVTHLSSLTLGSALPIASGGTGSTSTTYANLQANVTGTLPVGNGGTGITSLGTGVATFLGTPSSANLAAAVTDETGSGSLVFATSPTLTTPILGTPSSGTLTSCTGLPLTTGVTGTLPVGNGGSGATTFTANNVLLGNGTSAFQVVAPGSSGNILTSNGSTWQSTAPAGGGVTSLNGQTGAITNTGMDNIGSYITAVSADSIGAGGDGGVTTANTGDTIAGSSLRRNYSTQGPGAFTNSNQIVIPASYNQGGTALTGSYRCMGRGAGYQRVFDGGQGFWIPGMWVRIS